MKNLFQIVLKYMIKYFFAFLLIYSTSVIIFEVSRSSIEENILERSKIQVQEGIYTIEETIEKVELVCQAIYRSEGFSNLIYKENTHTSEIILQLKDSKNEMSNLNALTDYITYMFALFKKSDYFVSNGMFSIDLNTVYEENLQINSYERQIESGDQFKEFIFEKYNSGEKFVRLESIHFKKDNNKIEEEAILYLTDGIPEFQAYFHVFGFVLNKDYFVENILAQEIRKDGFLYVTDSSTGEVLLTYGNVPESIIGKDNIIPLSAIHKEYDIMHLSQKRLKWDITVGIPMSLVNEQMKSAQNLLIIYLGVGLAAVIIMTIYFSLGRYKGFKKVMLAMPMEDVCQKNRKKMSDYDILTHNVLKLDEMKETYRIQAKELQQKNTAILLENLMTRGEGTEKEKKAFIEYFGKEPEFYCVILVRFQTLNSIADENIATLEMVDFLTKKNLTLLGNVHSGVSDELFLVELSSIHDTDNSGLQKLFIEIAKIISEKYNCILHIGISTVGTGLMNVSRCYNQAKWIVQSSYLVENENVVQVYNIDKNLLKENPINTEFLNRLYNILICGRYADVDKELNQLEGYYKRMSYVYESSVERIFYSLENIFYTAMLQLNCKNMEKYIPKYTAYMPCSEMIILYKETAAWICDYIAKEKKSNNQNLKERILEILNEKYPDSSLSAYSVSQEVGIAENYLYHFWKNQTGETFATYLLRIRINKAKEYLAQTDYSNKEIAALTGFSSDNTFYRNFQKLTGLSPKAYKEKMQSQK